MAAKTPLPLATPLPDTEPPPPMLKAGQIVGAESGSRYAVERMLGKGGYSEVYKVHAWKDPAKTYAMKVEPNKLKNADSLLRLKVEIHVLEQIAAAAKHMDMSHFVKMREKGQTRTFKYYVMDVVWLSLKDVIEQVCKGVTSPSTKITIARQTLKSIQALHKLGFVHRDIRAANYAVGLPPNEHIIYMLDFCMAGRCQENDSTVKIPRANVPFIGNTLYASIRSMEALEQYRADDIEGWLYMMLEMYDKKNLPWRTERDQEKVLTAKKALIDGAIFMINSGKLNVPSEYGEIIRYIRMYKCDAPVKFGFINRQLDEIVRNDKIDMGVPLEWDNKKPKDEGSEGDDYRYDGGTRRWKRVAQPWDSVIESGAMPRRRPARRDGEPMERPTKGHDDAAQYTAGIRDGHGKTQDGKEMVVHAGRR